jgi:hypothetical protein
MELADLATPADAIREAMTVYPGRSAGPTHSAAGQPTIEDVLAANPRRSPQVTAWRSGERNSQIATSLTENQWSGSARPSFNNAGGW